MTQKRKDATPKPGQTKGKEASTTVDPGALQAVLNDLMARANQGDRNAVGELRRYLDRHPEIAETVGDLTRRAEGAWLDLLTGDNVLARESVQRELAKIKIALTGPHATTVEKMLVNEISVCLLARQHAEVAAASPGTASLAQAAFRVRRADSAQRRFLTSLKTLATLRALVPEGLAPLNSLRVYPEEQPERRQRA